MVFILKEAKRGYFDQRFNARIINVAPGGQDFAGKPGEVLSTVLGSCVAACIRDPALGVGGMNHFLLPDGTGGEMGGEPAGGAQASQDDMRFGAAAMEQLINGLIRRGAARGRLEAKLFGGATMIGSNRSISVGARNGTFALGFLMREGIPIVARDLGGETPRRANYEPATGRAWVNHLASPRIGGIAEAEAAYRQSIIRRDPAADLEVF
jgi:chemotaxis protein CheD